MNLLSLKNCKLQNKLRRVSHYCGGTTHKHPTHLQKQTGIILFLPPENEQKENKMSKHLDLGDNWVINIRQQGREEILPENLIISLSLCK